MTTYFFSDIFCISDQKIDERIGILEKFGDNNIIAYCRNGNHSKTVTKIFKENGFNNHNMTG